MCLFSADVQETKWLGSPITGGDEILGPAKGLLDQRQDADTQIGLRDGGSVVWKKRGSTNNPATQIVLLRTYVATNHIPEYVTGGTPDCPTCLVATTHPAHDEVVTNYVLGFWSGTNAVELLTAKTLAAVGSIRLFSGETYTVKTPVWETTNAVKVVRDHAPSCTLVIYVERGVTNEFHAWAVPVMVTTNANPRR